MMMKKSLGALAVLVALTACGNTVPASRNITPTYFSAESAAPADAVAVAPQLAVVGVEISVPRSLSVSEADVMVPVADIVWRGDAQGDRHAQVESIFQAASLAATGGLTEGRDVIVSLEVTRFHGLTEKARYLTGGNYAMQFEMTVLDAATGVVIDGPRPVVADIKGSGGVRAIAEDNAGRTEKVVVTERLAQVMQSELLALMTPPAL